jgi:molybdenum cofactor cytidylyltransferase
MGGVLGVVLAAGLGSRWSAAGGVGHKLTALLTDGTPVIAASVRHALEGELPVLVVTGAVELAEQLAQFLDGSGQLELVHNPRYETGQASSLRVALRHAERASYDAVVVGLGDQPWVPGALWQAVSQRLLMSDRPIIVPQIDGLPGQPVGLRQDVWALVPGNGDAGARSVIRAQPHLVEELPWQGTLRDRTDVDTPEDLYGTD